VIAALAALPEDWDDMTDPPEDDLLRERIVRAVRRERRTARLPLLVGAAASAVLLAGGGYSLGTTQDPPATGAVPVAAPLLVRAGTPGVAATAGLVAHTWGTEVQLVASGLQQVPYTVTLTTRDGRRVEAGSFLGVTDRPVRCSLNGWPLVPDVVAVDVTDPQGEAVLRFTT
jgi:hypothetical protein